MTIPKYQLIFLYNYNSNLIFYSTQENLLIYILLKAEAQRLMLLLSYCATSVATSFKKKKKFLQFLNSFYNLQLYKSQSYKCSPLLIYLLPLSPYNKLIQPTSYLFSSTIKPNPKPSQFNLKEKEIKNMKRSSWFGRKEKNKKKTQKGNVQGFA